MPQRALELKKPEGGGGRVGNRALATTSRRTKAKFVEVVLSSVIEME